MKPAPYIFASLLCAAFLSACGGGGSGVTATTAAATAAVAAANTAATAANNAAKVANDATFDAVYASHTFSQDSSSANAIDSSNANAIATTAMANAVIAATAASNAAAVVSANIAASNPSTGDAAAVAAANSAATAATASTGSATDVKLLSIVNDMPGTGVAAKTGDTLSVQYTGWLYSATAAKHHGAQFDAGTFSMTLGTGVVEGFSAGLNGIMSGGTRTIIIPSVLGYGAVSNGAIPANSGLVFDVQLLSLTSN